MTATVRPAPTPPGAFERIATLVHLERRVRAAGNLAELGFLMVNETLSLVPYRQAVLLGHARGGKEIMKVSGVAEPTPDAPFTLWIRRVLRHLARQQDAARIRSIGPADLPDELAADWESWLPPNLILVPLRRGELDLGVLALGRSEPLHDADARMLSMLADAYSHAWESLSRGGMLQPRQLHSRRRRFMLAAALAAMLALGFVPVPSAVLAPAEVIAVQPAVVRSALDGVVDRVLVQPNQEVTEGAELVQLDPRRLRSQLEASRMAAAATEAELRQSRQTAVFDPRARAQLPALQGRLDQQLAEVQFLEGQEQRLLIRAPHAGVAVFDNVHEWIGRPVTIGERIMQIADPARVELEIRLPVADAIQFPDDAEVLFFRNADPHRPIAARLSFMGYRAVPGPDGIVAYRLKARFDADGQPPRLGLKGTAKVYGHSVPLAYYILRRPLAAARVALGL